MYKSKPVFRAFCLILSLLAIPVAAQDSLTYQQPPQALADIVNAPDTPQFNLAPDRKTVALVMPQGYPTIAQLAQPELRIAGLRINPATNGGSRGRIAVGLSFCSIRDMKPRPVTGVPEGALIESISWSPDARSLAFTMTTGGGIELWVADVATAAAKRLTGANVNAAGGRAYAWMPDGKHLVVRLIPADRGNVPVVSGTPAGPVVDENMGKVAPAPTYQDLLRNPGDEALFEYYLLSQLTIVDLAGGQTSLPIRGIVAAIEPSPSGDFLLVETVHRPFSYLVPFYRFPRRIEVVKLADNTVEQIADLPLHDQVPISFDAVETGMRDITWRDDAPATLLWLEAQDEGDPAVQAEFRDAVFQLPAPFTGAPELLHKVGSRIASISATGDGSLLVSEVWRKTRQLRTWLLKAGAEARLLFDRSMEDRYGDPGQPLMRVLPNGRAVLMTAEGGNILYLVGDGASPEGNRPFLDRFDLRTGSSQRLWRSEAPWYERPIALLDESAGMLITSREGVDTPPNYFVRNLKTGELTQLTDYPHPAPALVGVSKELITYKRADGVELSATLYLPPGYTKEKGPLPMLMWAYPREFKSAAAASQVIGSPYSFTRVSPSGATIFLALGYAVLDGPTMPIIGEGEREPNDTYVQQLVASAQAAVDEVVRRGVADPKRIAVGGHSYGAFMTANLLAHCDLFATGIARSGAYNRTLTPFGFQAEERTYWQAPEIYNTMSPFMHADRIKEPILLIHGMADNNTGTFPLQSERFYNALKGHGATVRLVMLPFESHGYVARESLLHMLWEMSQWLERYIGDSR